MKLHFAILSILLSFVFNQSVFAQGNKNFCGHDHDQMQYWKENPAAFEDFQELLKTHFNMLYTFGDYALSEFDSSTSPRLILIAQKR